MKTLKTKPSNDVLLQIYGLYKQATVGDNTTAQPWAVQMEARAKWEAWTAHKGKHNTHTTHTARAESSKRERRTKTNKQPMRSGVEGKAQKEYHTLQFLICGDLLFFLFYFIFFCLRFFSFFFFFLSCVGKSQDQAKTEYIKLVEGLVAADQ